ncbi:MAG TPA: class I SAM-dependent methyltransferase [Salegentibacter sp.]|uniref:class I SAM-dependent methyltransferase n=1 Tax=Salegentibacter sp. TaxID=1903072 RepID=UPI002F933581
MNNKTPDKDIFGKAISAFFHNEDNTPIYVHSPDFDNDVIPVPYLFRSFSEMPPLEQKALQLSSGRVLDVGCGAGSHGLFLQNEKNLKVTGIDTSEGAIKIARLRGMEDPRKIDFFDLRNEKFDTILMLMNGSGIIGKLSNLDTFFSQAKNLLNENGKILLDSSDLSFLFERDEDGGIWVNPEDAYYGEIQFQLSYKNERGAWFNWLYIDFNSLELAAQKNNFSCKLIKKGEHYDYLAELKPKIY